MHCIPVSKEDLWRVIEQDTAETRLVSRIIFTDNLEEYMSITAELENRADICISLSDPQFCKGEDTIPDLLAVLDFLNENEDSNIVLPHLGEYLRVAATVEKANAYVHRILHRHVHSKKRLWIPIFAGRELFQSVVGVLNEERFQDSCFQLQSLASSFRVEVLGKAFTNFETQVDAKGLRQWFRCWVENDIKENMRFYTRYMNLYTSELGNYTLVPISDPYDYLLTNITDTGTPLDKLYGTAQQWAFLIPFLNDTGNNLEEVICRAFNILEFQPQEILSRWQSFHNNHQWLFFLWFKLNLHRSQDYISYAVKQCSRPDEITVSMECSIFAFISHENFQIFVNQRDNALHSLGVITYSQAFWNSFHNLTDAKVKLLLLTDKTEQERVFMLKAISEILEKENSLQNYEATLQDRFPAFLSYMKPSVFLTDSLQEYIQCYKFYKIIDQLPEDNTLPQVDMTEYESRGQLLYQLKNKYDAYFLWIDGLGIEWIDLLIQKIQETGQLPKKPVVKIATALLPTVTSVNMEKISEDTISGKKFDKLDALSHVKDKAEFHKTDYAGIVVKQLAVIEEIANLVCEIARENPKKDVVITADHGMSRLAAKGFHEIPAVPLPENAQVRNLGRYCIFPENSNIPSIAGTIRGKNVLAFENYHHFSSSGYAPGEIHGGATPEEMLVPVIHFKRGNPKKETVATHSSYTIESYDVYLNPSQEAVLTIFTQGTVHSLSITLAGNEWFGIQQGEGKWQVFIPGLKLEKLYTLFVHLNSVISQKEECIRVKRRGLEVDDDF